MLFISWNIEIEFVTFACEMGGVFILVLVVFAAWLGLFILVVTRFTT